MLRGVRDEVDEVVFAPAHVTFAHEQRSGCPSLLERFVHP